VRIIEKKTPKFAKLLGSSAYQFYPKLPDHIGIFYVSLDLFDGYDF